MLVDSHCHLDFPDFAPDLDAIVARAADAGIGRMVTISTRVKRLGGLIAIAERFPNVYCSVGTHPHHADEEDGIAPEELIELTRHPKVVALGEAGLDYFYDNGSPEAQARGFRAHIAAARVTGLPLVIHTRDADRDCQRILEEEVAKGPFRAVLHCYTGGRELAMRAIELGPVDLVHGHPDLQEVRGACASSRLNCRPTASWWRPTHLIWRPENSAASATSRPMSWRSQECWRRRAAFRWRRFRGRPAKISSGCSAKCHRRLQRLDASRLRIQIASANAMSMTESSPKASGRARPMIADTNASACRRNAQLFSRGNSERRPPSSINTRASSSA